MIRVKVRKIRARYQEKKTVLIHRDLENGAFWYQKRLLDRIKNDDRAGITFDCISCLMFLAFTFEAALNFFGEKLDPNWVTHNKVRLTSRNKMKSVFRMLKLAYDESQAPFRTIKSLKKIRDTFAHGKPEFSQKDIIVFLHPEKVERPSDLKKTWEDFCEVENVLKVYEEIRAVLDMMTKASGLDAYEMMTSNEGTLTITDEQPAYQGRIVSLPMKG
ncbi:MAG TPA: hypothetical protein VM144_10210 [Aestuariivirga sp.]|nr:hypothetical protein [Aestuariivirga sp.]